MSQDRRTALVVDDEDDARSVVQHHLQDIGWETIEAENGDECVTKAALHNPDLILLDVMMPGKTGFAAFKELRVDHRTSHIPVIMITAINDFELGANYSAEAIGKKFGIAPPEAFIEKPFSRERLSEIVFKLFEK